ncbi:MAG TPA: GNAT family N-acetyltransferase [Verrucomicrobia bacterium]|nr:MAG: hypothetical protein A2X46_00425 [Lentisphaerae bacterium GWF2_57_35]HBA82928.1 GNAT family N-acetyltransferase [Verrucomicrobiota bacterium]
MKKKSPGPSYADKANLSAVHIRYARPGDVPAMTGLLEQLFSLEKDFEPNAPRQTQGLQALLDDRKNAILFVAEAEGRVVGMCSLLLVTSTAEGGRVGWVEDVVLEPAWRGKGIGRLLMSELESEASRRKLKRLQLLADRTNRTALAFYHRLGWDETQLICLRRRPPS